MSGTHDSVDVAKHIRIYTTILVALLILTGVTVAAAQLHLSVQKAIILAMIIATIKGSLVCCYFMHLISEQKLIYWILVLAVAFFALLLWSPSWAIDGAIIYRPTV